MVNIVESEIESDSKAGCVCCRRNLFFYLHKKRVHKEKSKENFKDKVTYQYTMKKCIVKKNDEIKGMV